MWKWILIGAGVIVGIGIFTVIIIAVANPQGFADFFIEIIDETNVIVGGERVTIRINKFEGGTTPKDRVFLIQKVIAIHLMSEKEPEYEEMESEYSRALYDAAEDETLTAEENRALREMFSDKVPEEVVENWIDLARDLDGPDSALEEMERGQ